MKTFWYYTRLYGIIIAQYIKSRLAYRTDFIISTIGMVFSNLTGYASLWIIFHSIPVLAGYSYDELLFLYAFSLLAITPLQLFFDNIWSLRMHVQSGTFIKYYFKPINMMFYYMSEMLDLKGFAQLVFGIILLIISSSNLDLVWDAGSILALIGLQLSASLVLTSLMIMAASTAFWIVNSFSIMDFVIKFRDYARYPTSIFDGFFRTVFTFILPIGFIAFYPTQAILRPGDGGVLLYLTPLVGILLFSLACFVWSKGVRAWSGTGS